MSRENLRVNYALIVLLLVVAVSLAGCISLLQDVTADADDLQDGEAQVGPNETIETQIEDAQIEDSNVSTDVSGTDENLVRTRYDPNRERVEVSLTQETEADHLIVNFGGESTALAQLNEAGDRVVLTRDELHTAGEAEDLTRELYSGELGEGGVGGLSGVEYGQEVKITVRAVEGSAEEVILEESEVLGHGEVNAKVEYLFDSTDNVIRVVLSSNVNADYVDVDMSVPGGGTVAKFRLNEVGDEARIYADRPKVETRGGAEDLIQKRLAEAIEDQERHRNEEIEFDSLISKANDPSDGGDDDGDDDDNDVTGDKHTIFQDLTNDELGIDLRDELDSADDVDDIRSEISSIESAIEAENGDTKILSIKRSILKDIERDLTLAEAEQLTLGKVKSLFLKYNGQVSEPDDIGDFIDVLDSDVFDTETGIEANVDVPENGLIRGYYETPSRDELVNIEAVAHIEPRSTSSGIRQRGGTETTVLDATGEIRSGGYVELGEEVDGDRIELPSNGTDTDLDEQESEDSPVASLNTDRIAEMVHESLNEIHTEESLVGQEYETSYQLEQSAQAHSEMVLRNIRENEELSSIRSGGVPAQPTERNTAMRHTRNGAAECQSDVSEFRYNQGSAVVLSLDATGGGASVSGIIERAGTTSTRINADYEAPVTVPNYALPFVDPLSSWRGTDNVEAFVYEDLVSEGATEQDVADAIVDEWTNKYMDSLSDTSYNHQAIGVSADDETGVIYVTQSLC